MFPSIIFLSINYFYNTGDVLRIAPLFFNQAFRKEVKRAGNAFKVYGKNLACLTTEDNLLSATDEKQQRGYVVKIMDIMFTNKPFKTLLTNHPVIFSSAFSLSGEQHWRNAL